MIQSIKVKDLSRKELFELGRQGPYHRYVNFPVEVPVHPQHGESGCCKAPLKWAIEFYAVTHPQFKHLSLAAMCTHCNCWRLGMAFDNNGSLLIHLGWAFKEVYSGDVFELDGQRLDGATLLVLAKQALEIYEKQHGAVTPGGN